MNNNSIIENPKFWAILEFLVALEEPQRLEMVCEQFSLTKDMMNSLLLFLKEVNYSLKVQEIDNLTYIVPPKEKPKFTLHFNLVEWLAFQSNFPLLELNADKAFNKSFFEKLSMVEDEFKESDLFAPLSVLDVVKDHTMINKPQQLLDKSVEDEMVVHLERAILDKKCATLFLKNSDQMNIRPRKIVYVDNSLSLIAEDLKDNSLVQLTIWSIVDVEPIEDDAQKNFSSLEINDFISSIRAINENEVRLILKIYNHAEVNLNPDHIYFKNVCLVTNSEGEKIWASSVEPCEKLFEWIFEMGRNVEILDPNFLKKQYMDYCVDRLKQTG